MPRAWRTFAPPIILLILVCLLVYGTWWGWKQVTRPPADIPEPPCVTTSASVLKSSQVTVQVFNTGTTPGRAGQITEQLKNKGFITKSAQNAEPPVNQTTIVGGNPKEPAVALVAGFFPESKVQADDRTDGTVDVLVGDNFAGFKDDAPTQLDVPGGSVCLPSTSAQPR